MHFRQTNDAFIRPVGPYGYITNQTTKHDRVFDSSGREFLSEFSREARSVDEAVASLATRFVGVTVEQIKPDFLEFLAYLEKNRFAVSGETIEELDRKDRRFSYNDDNPKTFTFDFRQNEEGIEVDDTQTYLDEYLRKNPSLWSFQMEVTSRCNERCIHCYIPHETKNADIDFDLAISAIDQVAAMGAISITLSGGEATIYPRLPELIHHARKRDLSVTVLSNLVAVSEELFTTIVEAHLSLIQVSVYSMVPAEHEAITKLPGSLEKTLASIERLIAADVPVQISCPVMKINYKSYKNVLAWAYEHKIKAYTDFIMMARTDHSTGNLDQRIGEDEARVMLEDIISVDEDYRVMVQEEPKKKLFMDQQDKPVCGVGINTMCMIASGKCYPCAGWQGYTVGDLTTTSLRAIWEKSPQLEYLRGIKRSSFLQCQACPDQNYCAMCMVRNFNESGDIFTVPKHFCDMAALNREVVAAHRAKL